jgi:hypothetical protein
MWSSFAASLALHGLSQSELSGDVALLHSGMIPSPRLLADFLELWRARHRGEPRLKRCAAHRRAAMRWPQGLAVGSLNTLSR